jgi:ActR/RegA family two-component response regulator
MADKIKLLLVDDEKQFLETISTRLGMRDFDVTTANSGEEAIEAARKKEFEIALVDLNMPGIGGEKVLEILKREHKFMEVVILTGYGAIDSAIRAKAVSRLSGETVRARHVTECAAGGLSETRPDQTKFKDEN